MERDRRASECGRATTAGGWEFAEGGSGYFSTFLAVWNPNPAGATVRVYYRHENGSVYWQDVALPALGRAVLGTPSWMPAGGYGIEVLVLTGSGVVAERMIYGGPSSGRSDTPGPGRGPTSGRGRRGGSRKARRRGCSRRTSCLTNLAAVPATVTLTYRTSAGVVIGADPLVIPAYGRGTVWANGTTGGQDFTTEVTSTQEILAERAMYWPTGSSSLLAGDQRLTDGSETDGSGTDGATLKTPVLTSPYTLTEGTPGATIRGQRGDARGRRRQRRAVQSADRCGWGPEPE